MLFLVWLQKGQFFGCRCKQIAKYLDIIFKSRLLKVNPGYRLFYKHFLHSTLGERNLKLTREKPGCKLLAARTKLGKVTKWTYMFANSLLRTADWKATVGNLNLKKVR